MYRCHWRSHETAVSERNAPDLLHHPLPKLLLAVQDDPDHKTLFLHNYELYAGPKARRTIQRICPDNISSDS